MHNFSDCVICVRVKSEVDFRPLHEVVKVCNIKIYI